jgi:hypothetical protein
MHVKKRSVGCDCVIDKRKYTSVSAHQRRCSVLKKDNLLLIQNKEFGKCVTLCKDLLAT